jgi:hypothetical protein
MDKINFKLMKKVQLDLVVSSDSSSSSDGKFANCFSSGVDVLDKGLEGW